MDDCLRIRGGNAVPYVKETLEAADLQWLRHERTLVGSRKRAFVSPHLAALFDYITLSCHGHEVDNNDEEEEEEGKNNTAEAAAAAATAAKTPSASAGSLFECLEQGVLLLNARWHHRLSAAAEDDICPASQGLESLEGMTAFAVLDVLRDCRYVMEVLDRPGVLDDPISRVHPRRARPLRAMAAASAQIHIRT